MRIIFLTTLVLVFNITNAQNKGAIISGKIIDANDAPVSKVSIVVLGKNTGIISTDTGTYSLKVPVLKPFALVFSHSGFKTVQKNFYLNPGETEYAVIKLSSDEKTLTAVVITDDKERKEISNVKIDPQDALILPGATGGVEGLIKVLVGSNNELTSQYSVRGGNYDENSIYINDFEVYRPYLVSNGQQEGLSLINPQLAKNVNFYSGGFQARYGDKMSSILDIQYKKPTSFGGTAYVSLLEQGLNLEGSTNKGKLTFLGGIRNKSNRNLLSSQPTLGSYLPSSSDVQAYITYKVNQHLQFELLSILSSSGFKFNPESVKKTSSVFSPFYTSNIGLDIFFEGQEKDNYSTNLAGFSVLHTVSKQLRLKWMLSVFKDDEKENYDIGAAYLFGDRDFDNTSASYGEIINPLGQGYYQDYARNNLKIQILNATHKGYFDLKRNYIQWGLSVEQVKINDRVKEWEYRDSAGYSLPFTPGNFALFRSVESSNELTIYKYTGYLQDNILFNSGKNQITIQGGVRYNYNSLNNELLISPRIQLSVHPAWKKDLVLKAAGGLYQQPPFYRELRDYNGNIQTSVKAQKSVHLVAGLEYNFKGPGNRPFRLTSEAYYKYMTDVVPYDVDNVKIRYLGTNNATAYAEGIETRFFGELVNGAESWISLGIMRTRENLNNDYYYNYLNAAGEIINTQTVDKVITDSTREDVGFVRRPTDRLITAGLFLQDYLSTNKNFRVHMNILYGSNMSYNIPNSVKFRNALIIEPYLRVDLGFSVLLLKEKSQRRSHAPFNALDNAWLSLEVFNMLDRENTISYQLVKDFSNSTFAIPNRLTPRLINLKLVARFRG